MRLFAIAALLLVGPVNLVAQALPSVAPAGSVPDGTVRLTNTTGNQVTFTITNLNGGLDGATSASCGATGNVTITGQCPLLNFLGEGQVVTRTVTFATGAAGTGTVTYTVIPEGNPPGASSGTWVETIVNPAGTVTPDGQAVMLAPNLVGQTQVFTVTNTSSATTPFALTVSCPNPGATSCTLNPASLTLSPSGGTGPTTVTFTTGPAGSQGTITVSAAYQSTTVDQGLIIVTVPSASVAPATAAATPPPNATNQQFAFTVTNNGVDTTSYTIGVVCSGSGVSNCGVTPGTMSLMPSPQSGSSQGATMTYNAGAAGTSGTVTLQVKFGTTVLATGVLTVTVFNIPPTVTVTPDGGNLVRPPNAASSQTFTVTHGGQVPSTYNLTAACTAPGATGCPPSLSPITFNAADSQNVVVNFTSGGAGTTGRVTLTATHSTAGVKDSGFIDVKVVNATVVPVAPTIVAPANATGQVAAFTVTNTGLVAATFDFTGVCAGALVSACQASPTQLPNLAVNVPTAVNVTYNTGASGTGTVSLQAKFATVVIATGVSNVSIGSQLPPVVDVASVNPGTELARGQCLAVAIASASASECGDLRIVHPLPTVRTMNTWRTPTLVYNSAHAIGWVSIGANVTMPAGSPLPTTVNAVLKIGGTQQASGSWPGTQWTAGSVRRIALGFSAQTAGLATGVYAYSLEVTSAFTGNNQTTIVAGQLVIVNRSGSYFGAGWWLAGLEQWNPTTAVWIGGDGSARLYTLKAGTVTPNRVWGAPSMTYPDTLREVGTEFVRQLPDSVGVFFNAAGQHVRTRNRQGHVTTFAYTAAAKLQTITLPPTASPLSYTFNYDANGRVSTIVAPGAPTSRTTTLTIPAATGRITTITEPDTRTVSFGYGTDHKITSRTDRRGTVTSFQYDAGSRVSQSSIALVPGAIVRNLQQAGSLGWSGTAAQLSQVFSQLDGPRVGINVTKFYLNKYQAPDSIIDAAQQRARLGRGTAAFPGLVDTLTTVTGHQITAVYDPRGRILSSSEPSTSGATATTAYQWDPKWDQVSRITNPEGDFTEFGIDPVTGNRVWQQDGRGLTSRITFGYTGLNQLAAVALPNTADQLYTYDTMGNLTIYRTAQAYRTTYTNNAIGLTIRILSPTGLTAPGGPFLADSLFYTKRNEDSVRATRLSETTAWVRVTKTFDGEGNVLTAARTFSPRAASIQAAALTTTWTYDRANRVTDQAEPDGTAEHRVLDAAGNVLNDTTRRNCTASVKCVLVMTYDPLNRMLTRNLPGQSYAYAGSQIAPSTALNSIPYSYSVLVDNQGFGYSPDGQVTSATNRDASVTRTYHPNGRLLTETLAIKTGPRTGADHVYLTGYQYDRNGRRTRLLAPAAFTGDTIRYVYDPAWGALTSVRDIGSNTFAFNYNDRSELTTVTYPTSYTETYGYDQDGRLASDSIRNGGSQLFPFFPQGQLRNFTVTSRDGRGLIRASTEPTLADRVNASYDGLGHLLTANLRENLTNVQTGSPAFYATNDTLTVDALGNVSQTIKIDSLRLTNGATPNVTQSVANDAYSGVGRLTSHGEGGAGTTSYSYDGAGNQTFQNTTLSAQITAERASYYGPDERPQATDTRSSGRRTFEEYRYDALGRRVWVRSRTQCVPVNAIECITQHVRRTVWDGNQELAELRVPFDTTNAAIEEMDTGYPLQPYNINGGVYGDPNPFLGRVVYGSGLGIDQPLSVTRYDYRDNPNGTNSLAWPRFSWQVFWNYQGAAAYGLLTTGAVFYPFQLGGGQTSCPVIGDQTQQRCVLFQWPLMRGAYNLNRGNVYFPAWHGSLIQGKRDGSGLEDKRNRLYDPQTGRFTQEDPIGIAGGLNLYGFAESNPVNFGDPFGLCIPWPECATDAAQRMLTGLGNAVLSGLRAIGEVTGVAGLIRAFSGRDAAGNALGVGTRAAEAAAFAIGVIPPGGVAADATAVAARRILSAHVMERAADAADTFHNFPAVFDEFIFAGKRTVVNSNYVLYEVRGAIRSGEGIIEGTFQIGVRPSASGRTEVITHRFFKPDP